MHIAGEAIGNLVFRHFIPLAITNFACWVAEINTANCLAARAKKCKYFIPRLTIEPTNVCAAEPRQLIFQMGSNLKHSGSTRIFSTVPLCVDTYKPYNFHRTFSYLCDNGLVKSARLARLDVINYKVI